MTNTTTPRLTIADLELVTGGAPAFNTDSVKQPNFSFIRAGRGWRHGDGGEVVGTIGNNQRVSIKGDHAFVQHDGPFAGGHRFSHDGNAWKYTGSDR
jgi:hypothetical protein